ncbi:hypothetical protein BU23DRAFT_556347 [Bimuria novae-zelandiae CBS 107.79]|uniref:Uncharacterized protein n=1 Tax=Bimuria novae-zelandiae CBS 107.79 TaxID=1447943 RepID=A0A6A5V469_9PLEO|nr:hypothetical protein BU23DRAFT_556347 [Bimuria novae-zelandiae CBS 107.79]
MSLKAQSPARTASTSQAPTQARSRKAAVPAEQSSAGRVGSAGGVILEKESAKKTAPTTSTSVAANKRQPAPAKDKDAAETSSTPVSSGPNRQRRRPRKLNRDAPTDDTPSVNATTAPPTVPPTVELEALKSRVRGLEAKVEELYQSTEGHNRSPRRRGKGRKTSSVQSIPTLSTTTASPEEEEADEELVRAEEELESARHDLEIYQPRSARPKGKRSTSGGTEPIEEVPRDPAEPLYDNEGRQVTLTGSYRIPLPSTLNMNDVKTIQSGVSAAQNVARSFLEQRRANQATKVSAGPSTAAQSEKRAAPKPSRQTSGLEVTRDADGKSWGEWFGGYSMAISRAVKSIETEVAIESQKGPAGVGAASGGGTGTKKTAAGGKRSGAKGRQSEGAA